MHTAHDVKDMGCEGRFGPVVMNKGLDDGFGAAYEVCPTSDATRPYLTRGRPCQKKRQD